MARSVPGIVFSRGDITLETIVAEIVDNSLDAKAKNIQVNFFENTDSKQTQDIGFAVFDDGRGFETDEASKLRATETLSSLAPLAQGLNEQVASGMITAGQAERELDQRALDLAYQDFLQQQQSPLHSGDDLNATQLVDALGRQISSQSVRGVRATSRTLLSRYIHKDSAMARRPRLRRIQS